MIKKRQSLRQYVRSISLWFIVNSNIAIGYAAYDLISLFPLEKYNQTITRWINPKAQDYNKLLFTKDMQQKRLDILYEHYFGSLSPWNAGYITQLLRQSKPNDLKSIEQILIENYNNENKSNEHIGYGENYRSYDNNWIMEIKNNINLSQFDTLTYQSNQRGITIENLHARILPTEDVHFYDHKLAGQGFPFDNLQMSALWAGTPVYIITETLDHAWSLVVTPDFIAWVKSNGIARANKDFIETWTHAAKNKLVAITKTRTPIIDQKGKFLFSAYVGALFPGNNDITSLNIMVPSVDADHNAMIKYAHLSLKDAAVMPMLATPHHFSDIMKTLINRPYGWGGMYFYNDCSAELKSLFTPFGIWLPRHSAAQVGIGKMTDVTSFTPENRIAYLSEKGRPFSTLIYIGGHIFLYIGNYHDPKSPNVPIPITYQNLWGLSPNPPLKRVVIGKSVLFPILMTYSEDTSLTSLAAKQYFQVAFIDQLPEVDNIKQTNIDLKTLMYTNEY